MLLDDACQLRALDLHPTATATATVVYDGGLPRPFCVITAQGRTVRLEMPLTGGPPPDYVFTVRWQDGTRTESPAAAQPPGD